MARAATGCCAVMCLAISGTYTGLYWDMWSEAQDYDDLAATVGYTGSVPAYDLCGNMDADTIDGTQWSVILAFNSILYLCLSISTLCLFLGSFFPPLLCCGICGHCFGGCGALAALIVTGVFRFQTAGADCAENSVGLLKDHGEKIESMFIAQCVLYCFYGCFVGVTIQISIMAGGLSMASFFERNARSLDR